MATADVDARRLVCFAESSHGSLADDAAKNPSTTVTVFVKSKNANATVTAHGRAEGVIVPSIGINTKAK